MKVFSPHIKVLQLPNVRTIRRGQTVVLSLESHILAAYRLTSVKYWKQIHTNGTSRRQSAIQNLVVSSQNKFGEWVYILLTTNFIPKNKQSETEFKSILDAIEHKGKLLTKWIDMHELLYNNNHDIPEAEALTITISNSHVFICELFYFARAADKTESTQNFFHWLLLTSFI